MPKIGKWIEQVPVFLYGVNPQTGETTGPGGTGFVIAYEGDPRTTIHYYVVTNWHVAVEHGYSRIRINMIGGGARMVDFEPHEWRYISNSDDLAAIDVTDIIDPTIDQVSAIPQKMLVSRDFIHRWDLGFGEEVFMTGLLANHPGNDRNLPVARFGNIGRLADNESPVRQPNGAVLPCHIVDMRSRTGFSGSPVFVYRTPSAEIDGLTPDQPFGVQNWFVGLLGVHCGQFDEVTEFFKAEKIGDPILDTDKISVSSSMNIVIPSWRIIHLLSTDTVLKEGRLKREKKPRDVAPANVKAEAVGEFPTKADNPQHKEDFNRLLNAAAADRKEGSET